MVKELASDKDISVEHRNHINILKSRSCLIVNKTIYTPEHNMLVIIISQS